MKAGAARCSVGPSPCASSPSLAPPDLSGSRQCPASQPAAAIPADRRAPRAPPRPLMHFLFPIPSVETVFPVSDLHCPFQATPFVGALTRPRPCPRPVRGRAARPGEGKGAAAAAAAAVALGWAGKEAAPCLQGDQLGPRV